MRPGGYQSVAAKQSGDEIFGGEKKRSKRNNGINYLENTPGAEVPPEYYIIKETGDQYALKSDNVFADGTLYVIIF